MSRRSKKARDDFVVSSACTAIFFGFPLGEALVDVELDQSNVCCSASNVEHKDVLASLGFVDDAASAEEGFHSDGISACGCAHKVEDGRCHGLIVFDGDVFDAQRMELFDDLLSDVGWGDRWVGCDRVFDHPFGVSCGVGVSVGVELVQQRRPSRLEEFFGGFGDGLRTVVYVDLFVSTAQIAFDRSIETPCDRMSLADLFHACLSNHRPDIDGDGGGVGDAKLAADLFCACGLIEFCVEQLKIPQRRCAKHVFVDAVQSLISPSL